MEVRVRVLLPTADLVPASRGENVSGQRTIHLELSVHVTGLALVQFLDLALEVFQCWVL